MWCTAEEGESGDRPGGEIVRNAAAGAVFMTTATLCEEAADRLALAAMAGTNAELRADDIVTRDPKPRDVQAAYRARTHQQDEIRCLVHNRTVQASNNERAKPNERQTRVELTKIARPRHSAIVPRAQPFDDDTWRAKQTYP